MALAPSLLAVSFCVAMLFRWTFPLDAFPTAQGRVDQDCYQGVWNLWHVLQSILSGRNPFTTDSIYYPLGANLAHHTLTPGFFPFTAFVALISGGDRLYPMYTYKLLPVLCCALSLIFTRGLLRALGFAFWACWIGAIAYTYSRLNVHHLIHPNYLAAFFIPLCAWLLLNLYQQPSVGRALRSAFALGISVYFTELSLYMGLALACVVAILCAFSVERGKLAAMLRRIGWTGIAASLGVVIVLVGPYAWILWGNEVIQPALDESQQYAANAIGFFAPDPDATPVYGRLFSSLRTHSMPGLGGSEAFLGFVPIVLACIGFFMARRRLVLMSSVLALLFLLLSLGPTLQLLHLDTGVPMPYDVLGRLPIFESGRTPVRFIALGGLFLTIVAAAGMTWIERSLHRKGAALASAVSIGILAWLLAESYIPAVAQVRFVPPPALDRLAPGPVLNLPPLEKDGYAAMLQTLHGRPIATGYTARISRRRLAASRSLRRLFDKGGADFWSQVRANGFTNVVVSPRSVTSPYTPSLQPLGPAPHGVTIIDLRDDGAGPGPDCNVGPTVPPEPTSRIDFALAASEHFLCYGWGEPEGPARWSVRGQAAVLFRSPRADFRQLRMRTAAFVVPGTIDAQHVRIELNGKRLASEVMRDSRPREYVYMLPPAGLREVNELVFHLPDAESPQAVHLSSDSRTLGIFVEWLLFE